MSTDVLNFYLYATLGVEPLIGHKAACLAACAVVRPIETMSTNVLFASFSHACADA
jgi:hypothetical protein